MTPRSCPAASTAPFRFDSTAAEVVTGVDLAAKRAIVTGGSSGIGIDTARALAGAGAAVTLAVRDTVAGERTAAHITATTGNDCVEVRRLDLADPASVGAFVAGWAGPLHLLINNAGVMALPQLQLTQDGWELHVATNHLGHFALAVGLHESLVQACGARIVSLSSAGHHLSPVIFDDLHFAWSGYNTLLAYGQSKTAKVLFAVEAARRWAEDGITANAVHPGAISSTNLARHIDPDVLAEVIASSSYEFKTLEQGAATSVFVATSPHLEGITGRYFADCQVAPVVEPGTAGSRGFGVAAYALDPDDAERLWELSLKLLSDRNDVGRQIP
jgi:NAD(P)-dependent dehydrogenase (short-subunit alcohol dehydrogenase family)